MLLARLLGHSKPAARKRAALLLESFGLADAAGRQVKHYSGGMRRRIDIAASILSTPDLLFLDEPTTGLDPRSRNQVWDIVRAVVAQGTTVLLTTQYLDEADQLAGRIAVIDHGRVIAEGTPGQLKSSVGAGSVHLRLRDAGAAREARQVLSQTLLAHVQPEADPVALTARVQGGGTDAAPPNRPPWHWRSSPGPASPSTTSRWASPASTRSSSPSPTTPRTTTSRTTAAVREQPLRRRSRPAEETRS